MGGNAERAGQQEFDKPKRVSGEGRQQFRRRGVTGSIEDESVEEFVVLTRGGSWTEKLSGVAGFKLWKEQPTGEGRRVRHGDESPTRHDSVQAVKMPIRSAQTQGQRAEGETCKFGTKSNSCAFWSAEVWDGERGRLGGQFSPCYRWTSSFRFQWAWTEAAHGLPTANGILEVSRLTASRSAHQNIPAYVRLEVRE